ncbi:hypothetical protein [Nonomuraea jabiensis]|uniref:hypothetical protein n=1 Tax=Nonomuraea jabiensis TaxID=882448 RepID=UPI003D76435A
MSKECYACGQQLPLPPEPLERSVVLDRDDDAWQRRSGSWDCVEDGYDNKYLSWKKLNDEYGPLKVVYTP